MNIYILSSRALLFSVSHDLIYELENIIVEDCNATLLIPTARGITKWCKKNPDNYAAKIVQKVVNKTINNYQQIDHSFKDTDTDSVLLIIGQSGGELGLLSSIPQWRKRFQIVIAYLWDPWGWKEGCYTEHIRYIDHLFVPMIEVIEPLQKFFGVSVSLLPFGADVIIQGSRNFHRPIDVISYGRMPDNYHQEFVRAFNYPGSGKIYYPVSPRPPELFPNSDYENTIAKPYRLLFFKLLRRSKLAFAFDPMYSYPGMRKFPYSLVTPRWFECGGAGCGIIGKRPTTPLADELLNWEDATIELPDDPEESVKFVEELLQDEQRLQAIHKRNYLENLARHDWRYRIKDLLDYLKLPSPEPLQKRVKGEAKQAQAKVEQKTERAKDKVKDAIDDEQV